MHYLITKKNICRIHRSECYIFNGLLMSLIESAVDTPFREYRRWEGRNAC